MRIKIWSPSPPWVRVIHLIVPTITYEEATEVGYLIRIKI